MNRIRSMKGGALLLIGILFIPLLGGCLSYPALQSCEEKEILFEEECVIGQWTIIEMDFQSNDTFEVSQGEYIRLSFNSSSFGHYIPDTFDLEGYNISKKLSNNRVNNVDFLASIAGNFSYSSQGSCIVNIPGVGGVSVDCSIYCGETGNSRNGILFVSRIDN
ncbi:MAG: hypothetical protein HOF57_06440 [Euryarchaeota archaeon]|jgi:hypothetical protein|nr:hypothetical protein [Euryarchaeota archaeon]MBT3847497.1 hypothetical protein [Euryarchaeota archaeon]MBT4155957.1 hypothetical protein [Euryarchaeota archaeon]MBT4474915.1 hypothetical protein [Euryarchaeota archaeon]MBT4794373.1 hypothetical protein [Euryarchaeota archaeon]